MSATTTASPRGPEPALVSEVLILPDGQVYVHNLTPAFARLLAHISPRSEPILSRLPGRELSHGPYEFCD
jgi:hypothetical protein